ncbi:hypothetical protein I4U23_002571 [Adineta vaga]|nr:hypothetical protein I4U23_002571 [Adineta vaga]
MNTSFDNLKYSHVKKIILLSGKRKCGKDYIGEKLAEKLQAVLLHLSEPLKLEYARINEINGEELLNSSSYKENYRKDMIKWGEEKRRADPSIFCRLAIEQKDEICLKNPIWIICDIRRYTDVDFFQKYFSKHVLLVRIEASIETRQTRGWIFTPNIDDSESECQLDDNILWSFIFSNNNSDNFEEQMNKLIQLIHSLCMANLADIEIEPTNESSLASENDEILDPRVQIELERLNHANEAINHLELQLDEARRTLKEFCDIGEEELSRLEKSIGSAVGKARNYYDARIKLRDAREALTKAKHRFERAQALHVAAKELAVVSADYIDEAEKSNQNAATWNETYGQAIAKAADAEREKYQADLDQQYADAAYADVEKQVEKLQKEYRRAINKSQPYYEKKAEYHKELDFQKRKVFGLENCVNEAKAQYQESLRNLEKISNEIHAQRKQGKLRRELGERTAGVGEEQITYTEFEQLPPSPVKRSPSPSPSPKIPTLKRLNRPEQLLRSCLLRTEALPAGIFANTSGRSSPEGDETTPTNFNDQFLLNPKPQQPPPPIVVINSNKQTNNMTQNVHQRKSSDGYSSQITDDEDDKTSSLHVLTDEQLEHLACVYHPLPQIPTSSSQTGTTRTSSTQMSESLLHSLSNPLSKLVLR